jgi:hypothetical protein
MSIFNLNISEENKMKIFFIMANKEKENTCINNNDLNEIKYVTNEIKNE